MAERARTRTWKVAAHADAISMLLRLGCGGLLLVVVFNLFLVILQVHAPLDMVPYMLVDAGATAGLAGLSMANRRAIEYTLPDFTLAPWQRRVARLLLARFVALAAAAQATGIVTIWGIGMVMAGCVPEERLVACGVAVLGCLVGHIFTLIGTMIAATSLGAKKHEWHDQLLDWYARRELSG